MNSTISSNKVGSIHSNISILNFNQLEEKSNEDIEIILANALFKMCNPNFIDDVLGGKTFQACISGLHQNADFFKKQLKGQLKGGIARTLSFLNSDESVLKIEFNQPHTFSLKCIPQTDLIYADLYTKPENNRKIIYVTTSNSFESCSI